MAQLCLSDLLKTLSFIVIAFIASILFFATFTAFFSILDMEWSVRTCSCELLHVFLDQIYLHRKWSPSCLCSSWLTLPGPSHPSFPLSCLNLADAGWFPVWEVRRSPPSWVWIAPSLSLFSFSINIRRMAANKGGRVAKVVRRHEGPSQKSLDSDENLK